MAKVIIEDLSPEEFEKRQINSWPIWEKEVSCFKWTYDGDEECFILEGEVNVETDEGMVNIKPGDFVTFNPACPVFGISKRPFASITISNRRAVIGRDHN